MALINEKLKSIFANDTYQNRFFAAALEQLLGEEKTEALISEILPAAPSAAPRFKGQLLAIYNGLSRDQLKHLHGLSDKEVDELYGMMGVEETKPVAAEKTAAVAPQSNSTVSEGESEESVDAAAKRASAESNEQDSNTQSAKTTDKGKQSARK